MSQQKTPPIYSTCEDDPSQSDGIDRFVIGLAERVDGLQDAELEDDLQQLRALVTTLGDSAEALGYHPLAQVAARVARACDDEKVDEARAAMVELTDISGRIRRGHRGAA